MIESDHYGCFCAIYVYSIQSRPPGQTLVPEYWNKIPICGQWTRLIKSTSHKPWNMGARRDSWYLGIAISNISSYIRKPSLKHIISLKALVKGLVITGLMLKVILVIVPSYRMWISFRAVCDKLQSWVDLARKLVSYGHFYSEPLQGA